MQTSHKLSIREKLSSRFQKELPCVQINNVQKEIYKTLKYSMIEELRLKRQVSSSFNNFDLLKTVTSVSLLPLYACNLDICGHDLALT